MNFNEIIDRRNSDSLKWNCFDEDVIPLWVADMDFRCPEPVIDAIHARVSHGVFGYGIPPRDLPEIVVNRMLKLYNWEISDTCISFIPGCVTGFNLALRAFCQPGDAIIMQTPVYPPFLTAPDYVNMIRVENPLLKDQDYFYTIDFDLFEDQVIKNKVKLFILCNPHNPVGRVFTQNELERLADICLKHNVLICSDEIHCDLLFTGSKHIPIASLSNEVSKQTITLLAPSKTYNIAGLHASIVIIEDPTLRTKFDQARAGLIGNPSVLSLVGARAAYLFGDKWLSEVLTYLENNRNWLLDTISNELPGIKIGKPEGTFLGWMDCSQLSLKPNPCTYFLEQARVGLNDGKSFGDCGSQFVRFNFGSPRVILEEALTRMKKTLL